MTFPVILRWKSARFFRNNKLRCVDLFFESPIEVMLPAMTFLDLLGLAVFSSSILILEYLRYLEF